MTLSKTDRIRLALFGLAAAMFLCGGAVFYAGQQLLHQEETRARTGDEWRDELTRQLDLSVEQDRALGQILEEQRTKTRTLLETTEQDLRTLGTETHERILGLLEPGQKTKYQKLGPSK